MVVKFRDLLLAGGDNPSDIVSLMKSLEMLHQECQLQMNVSFGDMPDLNMKALWL